MFITFEGLDCSGKSTQSELLYKYFLSIGKKAILTKEPGGGGQFSLDIRKLLSTSDTLLLSELLAIYAARNEHIQKIILPALQDNIIVICDRFIDSSIAYYCYDKNYHTNSPDRKIIEQLQQIIHEFVPDMTFFINTSIENIMNRMSIRGKYDKYDDFNIETINKLYNVYKYLTNEFSNRIITIDGNNDVENVHDAIIKNFI